MLWTDYQQVSRNGNRFLYGIEYIFNFLMWIFICIDLDDETEEQLLSQWFTLVNKKNALLRRQMQLNIL